MRCPGTTFVFWCTFKNALRTTTISGRAMHGEASKEADFSGHRLLFMSRETSGVNLMGAHGQTLECRKLCIHTAGKKMSKKLNKLSSHFESGMEEHTKSNYTVRIECRKWSIKLSGSGKVLKEKEWLSIFCGRKKNFQSGLCIGWNKSRKFPLGSLKSISISRF